MRRAPKERCVYGGSADPKSEFSHKGRLTLTKSPWLRSCRWEMSRVDCGWLNSKCGPQNTCVRISQGASLIQIPSSVRLHRPSLSRGRGPRTHHVLSVTWQDVRRGVRIGTTVAKCQHRSGTQEMLTLLMSPRSRALAPECSWRIEFQRFQVVPFLPSSTC